MVILMIIILRINWKFFDIKIEDQFCDNFNSTNNKIAKVIIVENLYFKRNWKKCLKAINYEAM